jgi:D-alanyl-D-alanine carboxypeptidase/D-alanyl-D-alanine-endopeptidase (penicillin-binding protein 4)
VKGWRRLGALILIVAPPATASAATTPQAGATPSDPAAILSGTSVLSPRRIAAQIEADTAAGRLAGATAAAAGSQLSPGCVEVKQGSRLIYALGAQQPLLPASNMKLVTALAALDVLGPNYHFTTKVVASAPPENGVVYGNLYLVGGGDPLLRTGSYVAGLNPAQPAYTSLDQLAQLVRDAGIREVTGLVVGDDSRYDTERTVPTWKPVYLTEGDVAPLSALEVNDDAVPAPPTPPPSTTTTTTVPNAPPTPPPPPPPPPDPTVQAAKDFQQVLAHDGVQVEGGYGSATAPSSAVPVASVLSPPMSQEVDNMLMVSDDTAAELLTKELGYVKQHAGTTAAGDVVVRSDLTADRIDVSQLVNLDGSGLDRSDRVTCALLVAVLQRAGPSGVLASGLPLAAKSGTLAARFAGTPAAGRLRGKTGTLQDVASLSGFVTPSPNVRTDPGMAQPLTFSIVVNATPYAQGQYLTDRIAIAQASYPDVPPLSTIEPVAAKA